MVRTMRGCPTTRMQSEGKDEPETILNAPQQEGHPDAAVGKDIADTMRGQNPKLSQLLKTKGM